MLYFLQMSKKYIVITIGCIEISIGAITMAALVFSSLFFRQPKPPNVFMFVLGSAVVSSFLGFGLLRFSDFFRKLLIFFSGYVILTKIMVYIGILQFTGEIVTLVSDPVKNSISIAYHALVIFTLHHPSFKRLFIAPY